MAARAERYVERQELMHQKFTHQLGSAPARASSAAGSPRGGRGLSEGRSGLQHPLLLPVETSHKPLLTLGGLRLSWQAVLCQHKGLGIKCLPLHSQGKVLVGGFPWEFLPEGHVYLENRERKFPQAPKLCFSHL